MTDGDGTGLELTVEKRILLHLQKYSRQFQEEWEVPNALSQEGISESLDILLNNVSRAMKDLKNGSKVSERLAHIKGGRRKRRAYFLTEEGSRLAEEIREQVLQAKVQFVDKDGRSESLPVERIIGRVKLDLGELISATDVIEAVRKNGLFDATKFKASRRITSPTIDVSVRPVDFVDMTEQAPRPARFVGRVAVLTHIESLLEGAGVPTIVIHGMAGIGKTTVALKILDDLRGRSNLFYYRFHSWDSLANVSTALQDLLVSLGVRNKTVGAMSSMDINGQALFVARELGPKPVILAFDDFHKASDDIVPLFRVLVDVSRQFNGLHILLITRTLPRFYSRKEVSVDKIIEEVHLDGLDLEETKDLLGMERGEEMVERIFTLSRGVPLFIEILSRVDNVNATGDIRKFVEDEIFSELRPGERGILEGLSVHRYPVTSEAVLFDSATFGDLTNLARKSLVLELPHHRFEAHDLIKEYVYGRMSIEAKVKNHLRAAHFYKSPSGQGTDGEGAIAEGLYYSPELALLEAVHHMNKGGDAKGAAALMLKIGPELLEHGHLEIRGLLDLFDRADVEDRIWAELLELKGDAASATEDWPKALELYEATLSAKKTQGADKAILASIHGKIGMAQMHVERWEETVRSHESAYRMFEEAHDRRGMAKELIHLGMVFRNRRDWRSAEVNYEKAIKILEELDDKHGLVALHNNIAKLMVAKGDIRTAKESLAEGLKTADDAGYEIGRAVILSTSGEMAVEIGNLDEARKSFKEATELFRKNENFSAAISVQMTLGDAFLDAERPKEAEKAYLLALDIYQFKKGRGGPGFFRREIPEDLGTLGRIYDRLSTLKRTQSDLKGALSYDLKALDCFETNGDGRSIARKLLDAGRTCEDLGDLQAALTDFKKAFDILSGVKDLKGIIAVRLNIARILEALDDVPGAINQLHEARSVASRAEDREAKTIIEGALRRLGGTITLASPTKRTTNN